jgi:tRNA (guanine-N7-)-methyltransferase
MRIRKKRWARPELEASSFVITDPFEYRGKWAEEFENPNPIYLELGCGMGRFISENAFNNPDINFIGIDLKNEVLMRSKRSVEKRLMYNGEGFINVRLIPLEIAFIEKVFDRDEISRIYINFCNPWPKIRHNKRRLTYTTFLNRYKTFLKPHSQIWFKTDDKDLFEASQEYFKGSNFSINYLTYDLHKSDFKYNIETEYENKFTILGKPTMFLIAELN